MKPINYYATDFLILHVLLKCLEICVYFVTLVILENKHILKLPHCLCLSSDFELRRTTHDSIVKLTYYKHPKKHVV